MSRSELNAPYGRRHVGRFISRRLSVAGSHGARAGQAGFLPISAGKASVIIISISSQLLYDYIRITIVTVVLSISKLSF